MKGLDSLFKSLKEIFQWKYYVDGGLFLELKEQTEWSSLLKIV